MVIIASTILIHNVMQIEASKDPEYQQAHAFSIYLVQPFLITFLALLCYNWYPSSVFVGDTLLHVVSVSYCDGFLLVARRYIDQKVKVMGGTSTEAYLQKLDKVIEIIMYITLQNLRNMAKSKKIVETSDRQLGIPPITTTLGGNNNLAGGQSRRASKEDGDYMPLEDEGPDNAVTAATKVSTIRTRELGIPPITTTLGGNNDSARRRPSEEDGDYMPLEDEGPDNIVAAATKASKSRTTADTRIIRTRATSRQANDAMLSPVDIFDGSSQQVRRDNAAPSSVGQGTLEMDMN
ncbi:LOW QUALITY PROTEIN: hypothetical protein Cgig2_026795 [Carnegiea gigantea]|uniref:Uncharacterized protein n=1 Tax=Carnegiea gigantea TaxID=171969 RepID=A0A9Q1JL04_9CARY|nr:LOW QUALITY PROTEIN: hypothetical protein Cgig2_026795 [Carnegiea gigantea]